MWILPSLFACGATHSPSISPSDAQAGCVVVDHLASLPRKVRRMSAIMGTGHVELVGCSSEALATHGVRLQEAMVLSAQRVSVSQWRSIDSAASFVHYEGLQQEVDPQVIVAAVIEEGWSAPVVGAGPGLQLPDGWPGSTEPREPAAPSWWAPPQDRGQAAHATYPASWSDCRYPRGKGIAIVVDGSSAWLIAFNQQHFFPQGGCGG